MAEDSMNSLKESSFNKELNQSVPEIMEKYVSLVVEYTTFIRDKNNILYKKHYPYILARGLDTITHVFIMILFYTKNIELTYYHSQKSFYYYVEFIEQILDVQHTFLHLSSRDASIFVYKKTIYEINQEHRKETENNAEDDERFKKINAYTQIYKEVPIEVLPTFHATIIKLNLTMEQLGKVFNYVSDGENDALNFHQIIFNVDA
jgi:hypothetical protein